MEACVRGFSFMPDAKTDVMELQYIEPGELERSWKATRRERLREQEQRIWKEFVVNEQDVLGTFCKDDPYQFLEQLPQDRIEELLKIELQKMKLDKEQHNANVVESNQVESDSSQETADVHHMVTFAEEDEKEDCDMFHIFDDDKDDEMSGPEDEILNESMASPSTVRGRPSELTPTSLPNSPDKVSSKSSVNVCGVIESSIYCAKVRGLRVKLSEELAAVAASLEQRDVTAIEPDELVKMCRRSAEFSARFNRIHLYQLQRQVQDVKRSNVVSLPFAKHTQFQSQMVRIVSLHQNMLQSFQVFHKSFVQTACARESTDMLCALIEACREATLASSASPAPPNLAAAKDLYADDVLATCDRLQATVDEYATQMANYIRTTENINTSRSRGSSRVSNSKKRSLGTRSTKSGSKCAEADARLSMYSLDTLRWSQSVKPASSKDGHCRIPKMAGCISHRARVTTQAPGRQPNSNAKKSPRSRRPLMRDPQSGQSPRALRKPLRDTDIQTMVEAVDVITCASSRDMTPDPPTRRKDGAPRRASRETTPRNLKSKEATPRKPILTTPKRPQTPTLQQSQRLKLKNAILKPKSPKALESDISEVKDIKKPSTSAQCSKKDKKELCDTGNDSPSMEKLALDTVKGVKIANSDGKRESENERTELEKEERVEKTNEGRNKVVPARCEVTRIVRQLCGGDSSGTDRATGAKNAQLLCITGGSPRQPSTPQLLRILEETIQKKVPKPLFQATTARQDTERHRLVFDVPEKTTDRLLQYRTQFVQHMITSPMYANSVVGKPWEVIGRISEQIIDDLLLACTEEMQLPAVVRRLYNEETC